MTKIYTILILILFTVGCGSQKIKVPDYTPANLSPPSITNPPDFLIESVDLIDRSRTAGKVGDRLLGTETDLKLTNELIGYLESNTVNELQSRGFRCAQYDPGRDYTQFVESNQTPPLHLRLELQDLALMRQSAKSIVDDHVLGTCKLRGVLLDPNNEVLFSRQFVGIVDTKRPTEQLVPSGVRFISHRGLSSLLTKLLESTVDDFRRNGVPEIASNRDRYASQISAPANPTPAPTWNEPAQTPSEPITIDDSTIEEDTTQENETQNEDVEWVW